MLQALREIEGGIQLSLNVAARLPKITRAPIFESFLRQVYFTGVTAATGVILRACGLGVIIIAVMMNMLDADVDLAVLDRNCFTVADEDLKSIPMFNTIDSTATSGAAISSCRIESPMHDAPIPLAGKSYHGYP